jgi:hypothetical protein
MALQVKLYSVPQEDGEPEYISPIPAKIDDTYASFRVFLEEEGLIEFSFDFWMIEDKKRMLQKSEKWNSIAAQVHVIPKVGLGDPAAKRRRIDECCDLPTETAQDLDSGDDCPQEPSSSTRSVPKEVAAQVSQLLSQLVAKEVIAKY